MRSDLFLFLLVLVQPSPMDLHDQLLDAVAEDEVHEGVLAKDENAVADLRLGLGLAKLANSKNLNFAEFGNFLAGSFSAVSKRNFAIKYAFDSIFQVLQNLHTSAPLQS